uniref:FKB95-like N-terminal Kelch domain-containing protein n=1 Tax=Davidia involucrata TaxID=16924 RepID=A0A5B6YK75_DAVIN
MARPIERSGSERRIGEDFTTPKAFCIRAFGWGPGESEKNGTIRLYEVNLSSPESLPMIHPICKTNHPIASCCVSVGSTIYCIGANPDHRFGFGRDVLIGDFRYPEQVWKQGTPMLNGRWFPHAVAMAGEIYVFGGCRVDTDLWAEVYNPEKDEWKPLMKPPSEITNLSCCKFFVAILDERAKKILVGSCCGDLFYVYDAIYDSWEQKKYEEELYMMSCYTKPALYDNTLYWLDFGKIYAYDLNAKRSFCGHFECREIDDLLDVVGCLKYQPLFFHLWQEEFCFLWIETVVHPSSSRPHRIFSRIHWVRWRISKNIVNGSLSISTVSKGADSVKHHLSYIDSMMLKG